MQQLIKDLEEKLADSENSRSTEEEISKELQEQVWYDITYQVRSLLDVNFPPVSFWI